MPVETEPEPKQQPKDIKDKQLLRIAQHGKIKSYIDDASAFPRCASGLNHNI